VTRQRPAGVTVTAIVFFSAAAYLLAAGLVMVIRPGLLSIDVGWPLLTGLELTGPIVFFVVAGVDAVIGLGLLWLENWIRWFAILVAVLGVAMLFPSLSAAVFGLRFGKLAWGGLGVILRVLIVQYLVRPDVRDAFEKLPG
jgi:uncharacterized protein involved in cysteine biosynthesis